jgi:3' terminal RNA ribose 2'-O-methyltransferase Hen1
MLLTVSTTHRPATDLGFLLGRNTERCQSFPLPFGQAHVFYPVADVDRCTAALLLEFDPVRFVRDSRNRTNDAGTLSGYVNDRPYVASSLMSIAMARAFAPGMSGESRDRPKLVDTPIDLEATLSVLRCREGAGFIKRIFEPLGYTVETTPIPFPPTFAGWGESPYHAVKITARTKLKDLVSQLYLLLPVLDDDENYEVGDEKLVKLIERREGWLRTHPERDRIAKRYTKPENRWVEHTVARVVAADTDDLAADDDEADRRQKAAETPDLEKLRTAAVMTALREASARRVADLACGTGTLMKALLPEPRFKQVIGIDASIRALDIARVRLAIEKLPPEGRERVGLHQGAPTYRDAKLAGLDAICLVDYLERIDRSKLPALERVVFEFAKPTTVVFTTANADHGTPRPAHSPHASEWTRTAFEEWATETASRFGYEVRFVAIGPKHEQQGSPSQMAVWTR